jgi:hypothetical protein
MSKSLKYVGVILNEFQDMTDISPIVALILAGVSPIIPGKMHSPTGAILGKIYWANMA